MKTKVTINLKLPNKFADQIDKDGLVFIKGKITGTSKFQGLEFASIVSSMEVDEMTLEFCSGVNLSWKKPILTREPRKRKG